MVTLYDVPVEDLLAELATRLQDHIEEPDWAAFVKSGPDRELPPDDPDFWYRRAASIFRTVAMEGPVGVGSLATAYGGPKQGSNRYRVAPTHRADASRKIIRTILQQLEDAGFVEESPGDRGRIVTPEGRSFLDDTAGDVIGTLDRTDLERYV